MIREIKAEDFPQLIALLKVFHSQTKYAGFPVHWPTVIETIIRSKASPLGFVRVAENGGRITGVIVGIVDSYWWANQAGGACYVTDIVFHSLVPGDGVEMLKQLTQWAWTRPRVVRVECGVASGIGSDEAIEKLYGRAGFSRHGPMFQIENPMLGEPK